MRASLTLLLTLLLCTCGLAQNDYFQQDVSYDITVMLNDQTHELLGQLTLEYTNNSPDELKKIPFHIWPNAYSSRSSAFSQQKLRAGNTYFYFADTTQRGGLDGLNFTVDGQPVGHEPDPREVDIVYVSLPKPLASGASITIRTPFRVDIPASFSRLGHVGESYQLTQWYPKPAVYDQNGWHAMPYLDQGEFYSEFGDFRVRITLPYNYIVGATGVLQEADEREWLLRKATEDEAKLGVRSDLPMGGRVDEGFPISDPTTKTLTYVAENVHDFAWFADKRFKVLHDTLQLPGRAEAVDVWSMFTEAEAGLWVNSIDYLKRATRFYSERIGTYPYPQVTGVQSALSAGGGMEYPMVTVIGLSYEAESLDIVLTHEVGHNWFYGILGSNERQSPWMDEGLNSYYEERYHDLYYENEGMELPILGNVDENVLGFRYFTRQGRDQAPNTRADSLSEYNYWIQAYSKPSMALKEVELATSPARLDAAMQAYYQRWKFKHPQPTDLFDVLEAELDTDLRYFRQAMLTTETSDWSTAIRDGRLHLGHSGKRLAPVTTKVTTAGGEVSASTRVPGKVAPGATPAERTELPTESNPLDLWTSNNSSGWRKLKLGFAFGDEEVGVSKLFAAPIVGYNIHDGFQLGAALHNRTTVPQKLEWLLAPMYGFKSSTLNGFGGLRYRLPRPMKGVRQLILSAGTQQWSDFTLARTDEAYSYARSALKAELFFNETPIKSAQASLFAQLIYLDKERPNFEGTPEPVSISNDANLFARIGYQRTLSREINPLSYSLVLEYKTRDEDINPAFETSHLRLDATVTGGLQYERGHFFRYRLFGGYFLHNNLRDRASYPEGTLSLIGNAESDYRRDGLYLGRNPNANQDNWGDQQLAQRQGGFRAPINAALPGYQSNNYMLATNLDVDLPLGDIPIPLGVFLDAGYYGFRGTTSDPTQGTFSWVGGVSLTALQGKVGIYAPFVADPETRDLLEQRGGLLSRLSFRLSLGELLPWVWVDDVL